MLSVLLSVLQSQPPEVSKCELDFILRLGPEQSEFIISRAYNL